MLQVAVAVFSDIALILIVGLFVSPSNVIIFLLEVSTQLKLRLVSSIFSPFKYNSAVVCASGFPIIKPSAS
jgi:hypothetical protein